MRIPESIAYLFGSIQPDICFISYFRHVEPGDERSGHNFSTAIRRIEDMEISLVSDGITAAYMLGKMTHYAADSFTYSHNPSIFHGSLKDHMKYERVLDECLENAIESDNVSIPDTVLTSATAFIKEMHRSYETEAPSAEHDIVYIISAAFILRTAFTYEENRSAKHSVAI